MFAALVLLVFACPTYPHLFSKLPGTSQLKCFYEQVFCCIVATDKEVACEIGNIYSLDDDDDDETLNLNSFNHHITVLNCVNVLQHFMPLLLLSSML